MTAEVRVGTSGYSFADWIGPFYPAGIEKGKMLDFYVKHFDTVEVNSTYYRIPHFRVMANLEKKTPPEFRFMVKAHSSATHERDKLAESAPAYFEALQPLAESGKLRGILAQFPWSFKRTRENAEHLRRCRDVFADYPLFMEFRHNSWLTPKLFEWLSKNEIGYVSVDEPQLEGMLDSRAQATTGIGYIRLHGRNAEQWWNGGPLRYDYLYSDQELAEWVGKIEQMREQTETIYVFFNNCHEGQAVTNARRILEMLDVATN
ncbi:MAG: DUF72 domain-containing protein, partial [bacterium]